MKTEIKTIKINAIREAKINRKLVERGIWIDGCQYLTVGEKVQLLKGDHYFANTILAKRLKRYNDDRKQRTAKRRTLRKKLKKRYFLIEELSESDPKKLRKMILDKRPKIDQEKLEACDKQKLIKVLIKINEV